MVDVVAPRPQDAPNVPREADAPAFRPGPRRGEGAPSWGDLAPEPVRVVTPHPPADAADPTRGAVLLGTFVAGLIAGTVLLEPLTGGPFLDARAAWSDPPEVVPTAVVAPIVAQGFAVLDTDAVAAAGHFRAALELDPGDPTAALGLGTALVARGDVDDAQPWLCMASRSGGVLAASAEGLLAAHRLRCP